MIASLGDFDFEVSSENIRTFNNLKFSHSAAYSEHKLLNRKGVLEFTGINASSCSLTISLDSFLGNSPIENINIFKQYLNDGEALTFLIGGEVVGDGLWVIESMNETHEIINNKGEVLRAKIDLNLKEYLENE